tara:strand:+ start:518 stop:730 length:213 start_codon:yes stop_codon:yes gene_type:complete
MNKKYESQEILEAVNMLLKSGSNKKSIVLKEDEEKPLELRNEVKNYKSQKNSVPKNTEKIIIQAEKFLKK